MKRRKYPDNPCFYSTFEGAEISHLLDAANLSVSGRFDLLDQAIDMAEEIWDARERRLAREATLKILEQNQLGSGPLSQRALPKNQTSHLSRVTLFL